MLAVIAKGDTMWIKANDYKGGTLRYDTLDGKQIAYHCDTAFCVQVGRGSKGSYKNKYVIRGSLARAVLYYNGINIGNGYKKRLLMPSASKRPVLARQF
jgi:hypothetical protein